MINHRLLFLFQWKYMRENLFNGTSVNRQTFEDRGGESSPPFFIY